MDTRVLDADIFGDSADLLSLKIIREFEPSDGYFLAFSGGKDSIVLKDLALRAGVSFTSHYSQTGIDPPEVVYFIRQYHQDVIFERPLYSFFEGILRRKTLPTRRMRWCCHPLKECHGDERTLLTGIRASESANRSRHGIVHHCLKRGTDKININPMLHWKTDQVWTYIHRRNLPYCSLYDEGWKRIGCILCPNEKYVEKMMNRWPRLFEGLRRYLNKIWPLVPKWHVGWKNADAMYYWWLDREASSTLPPKYQMIMDMGDEDEETFFYDQFDEE